MHTYAKYFKLETPEKLINAEYFHNYGFFVGNSSIDLTNQLRLLHKCLEEYEKCANNWRLWILGVNVGYPIN